MSFVLKEQYVCCAKLGWHSIKKPHKYGQSGCGRMSRCDKEAGPASKRCVENHVRVLFNTVAIGMRPSRSVDNGNLCAIFAEVGITGGTIAKFMVMRIEILRSLAW